jgi:hypothetical protein
VSGREGAALARLEVFLSEPLARLEVVLFEPLARLEVVLFEPLARLEVFLFEPLARLEVFLFEPLARLEEMADEPSSQVVRACLDLGRAQLAQRALHYALVAGVPEEGRVLTDLRAASAVAARALQHRIDELERTRTRLVELVVLERTDVAARDTTRRLRLPTVPPSASPARVCSTGRGAPSPPSADDHNRSARAPQRPSQ